MAGATREPWSDAEDATLRQMATDGKHRVEIGAALGRSESGVRQRAAALDVRLPMLPYGAASRAVKVDRIISEKGEAIVSAPQGSASIADSVFLGRIFDKTDEAVEKARTERFCEVTIVSKQPIGLVFWSDLHLTGDGAHDIRGAFADAELTATTQGMYGIGAGDSVNNHLKHHSALIRKESNPGTDYRVFDNWLKVVERKALALITGNHDDWTVDLAGIDLISRMSAAHKIHCVSDEIIVTLKIVPEPGAEPTAEYRVKVRHQYRYGSSFNPNHTVKRLWEMGEDDFDIGVIGHTHDCGYEVFTKHGLDRVAIRPGTYQVQTSYSRRFGFNRGDSRSPAVILWPDRRHFEVCRSVRTAAPILTALRASWGVLREAA